MLKFSPGDRVEVVSGPTSIYIGGTGTVRAVDGAYVRVEPDFDFAQRIAGFKNKVHTKEIWDFLRPYWGLEHLEEANLYVPEDWS